MTLKIDLVNMPFAGLSRPSIGLTQLKTIAEKQFGQDVSVRINYLNHDFGKLLGKAAYRLISETMVGHVTGLGEWFFRQVAFPDLPDNRAAYFARFGRQLGRPNIQLVDQALEPLRLRLASVIDDLIIQYRLDQADVVGMTSMFFQNVPSIALARRLRKIRPDQIILMGGANCEEEMGVEWARQIPEIDFIFSGHGLISFPQFLQHVISGDMAKCHNIKGIYSSKNVSNFEQSDDVAALAAPQPPGFWKAPELDINEAVELDYDDYFASFDKNLVGLEVEPDLPFETSRGCWWGAKAHCTFCGLNGGDMSYRAMSPDIAKPYINKILNKYSARAKVFGCVDNIMPREYFQAIFRDLRPPEGVELFYEVKADLTEEQVRILRDSSIKHIQPGVESLSTTTLKSMRKGTTAFGNIKLLLNCKKYGILPEWNLLIGFPGETAEVYESYMKFLPSLSHLQPPFGVFPVRFDRFSPYFVNADKYDLRLEPYEYYSMCLPFAKKEIQNIAYYFQDSNIAAQYIADLAMSVSGLSKIVTLWRERWNGGSHIQPPVLKLSLEDGKPWITDSRGKILEKLPISDAEHRLLCACLDPVEESALRLIYRDAVDLVIKKNLVFMERGRIMNIVSDVEIAPDVDLSIAHEPVEHGRPMSMIAT